MELYPVMAFNDVRRRKITAPTHVQTQDAQRPPVKWMAPIKDPDHIRSGTIALTRGGILIGLRSKG